MTHHQPRLLENSDDPIMDALRFLDVLDRLEAGDRSTEVVDGANELADLLDNLGDRRAEREAAQRAARHPRRR